MKVEPIMTIDVKYRRESDSLDQAVQLMCENDCGFIRVIAATGRPKPIGTVADATSEWPHKRRESHSGRSRSRAQGHFLQAGRRLGSHRGSDEGEPGKATVSDQ